MTALPFGGVSLVISSGAGGEVEKSYYLCMIKLN